MFDVMTIGSATMDVFVESDEGRIVSVYTKTAQNDFMAYPYGSKVEIDGFSSHVGGGGVNAASSFAKLGFKTGAIVKIGEDCFSSSIIGQLVANGVDSANVIKDKNLTSGFSIILVSFQGDRTVLAQRGANAEIKKDDLPLEAIKNSKFLYIAPLNGNSGKILSYLAQFAQENGVMTCVNAGSTSIKRGFNYLKPILETAEVVVMNKEEASMCTKVEVRPDTKSEKFSNEEFHPDIVEMLKMLKVADYQVIVITDGKNGAYAYDGKKLYHCPIFKGEVVSSLGAGDAFASTFCAMLGKTKLDIEKSLMLASINSGSVVSKFSATEGLLSFEELKEKLASAKDYECIVKSI